MEIYCCLFTWLAFDFVEQWTRVSSLPFLAIFVVGCKNHWEAVAWAAKCPSRWSISIFVFWKEQFKTGMKKNTHQVTGAESKTRIWRINPPIRHAFLRLPACKTGINSCAGTGVINYDLLFLQKTDFRNDTGQSFESLKRYLPPSRKFGHIYIGKYKTKKVSHPCA